MHQMPSLQIQSLNFKRSKVDFDLWSLKFEHPVHRASCKGLKRSLNTHFIWNGPSTHFTGHLPRALWTAAQRLSYHLGPMSATTVLISLIHLCADEQLSLQSCNWTSSAAFKKKCRVCDTRSSLFIKIGLVTIRRCCFIWPDKTAFWSMALQRAADRSVQKKKLR